MVNLLKKQLTANEIRYRTYDYITTRRRPSCIPAMHRIHGGTPSGPMSVSLEKQIKDRHGYVAVFLYMICQGGFIPLGLSLRRCR